MNEDEIYPGVVFKLKTTGVEGVVLSGIKEIDGHPCVLALFDAKAYSVVLVQDIYPIDTISDRLVSLCRDVQKFKTIETIVSAHNDFYA